MKHLLSALGAAAMLAAAPAGAAESVNLMLNWTPTADHSPIYFAKAKGWYSQAGLDVTIEAGKGSAVSAQRIMSRKSSRHKPRRASVPKSQNGHAKSCPKETVGVMGIIAKSWAGYCSTWKQTPSMMRRT